MMILLYGSTAWTQVKPSTGRIYFSKLGDKSRRQNFKRYPGKMLTPSHTPLSFSINLSSLKKSIIASSTMSKAQTQILFYLFITFFIDLPFPSFADVGVAAQYSPPYLRMLMFPSNISRLINLLYSY